LRLEEGDAPKAQFRLRIFRERAALVTHKYPPTLIQNPLMKAAMARAAMKTGNREATRIT